jgi:hypothetical protein
MKYDYEIISEKHIFDKDFKIKWLGEGEWVQEPDKVIFEYLSYKSEVRRILNREPFAKKEAWFGGHLCGYVKVPAYPNLHRESFDDLECHGGITHISLTEDDQHWIGFDCAHCTDKIPSIEHKRSMHEEIFKTKYEFKDSLLFNPIYRNISFVIENCCYIINQLNMIIK